MRLLCFNSSNASIPIPSSCHIPVVSTGSCHRNNVLWSVTWFCYLCINIGCVANVLAPSPISDIYYLTKTRLFLNGIYYYMDEDKIVCTL